MENVNKIEKFENFLNEKKINEAGKWESKNLSKDFYNLWASLDLIANNLGLFMDDMNKGKSDDAFFSLDVAYTELIELLKSNEIKKILPKIEKELKDRSSTSQ